MDTQIVPAVGPDQALINLTWGGCNFDLPVPVSVDITDEELRSTLSEIIRSGSYGIDPDQDIGPLQNYKMERDGPNATRAHNLIVARPATPFG